MSIIEKFKNFWNITLGVDCKEQESIEGSNNPENKELQESLARVEAMCNNFSNSSNNSAKGGKSKIVPEASVNEAEAAKSANQKSINQREVTSREELQR